MKTRYAIIVSFSLLMSACGAKGDDPAAKAVASTTQEPVADAKVEVTADEATKKLAEELKGQIKDGALPYPAKSDKGNQKAVVYLAAQADEVDVIAAGLDAMAVLFNSNNVDEEYKKVVRERLTSTQGPVLDAALAATRHATTGKTPDAEIVEHIHRILASHPDPVARYEATQIFVYITDAHKNNKLLDALYDNLSSDKGFLVSGALFALGARPFYTHKKAEVRKKAIELFKHADPGARGRAIYLVERIAEDKGEVAAAIAPLLDDPHPFVKSTAARALASLQHYASIEKIAAMLNDKTSNTYAIDYKRLNGKQGKVLHDGSNYSMVGDAMIYSIQDFIPYGQPGRFEPSRRQSESVEEWIDANAKAARAWIAANRDRLQ